MTDDCAELAITVSKKARIAVFNIQADDTVVMLYPHALTGNDAALTPGTAYAFPARNSGLSLEMATLKDHKRDSEAFFVVAYPMRGTQDFSFDNLFSTGKRYTIPEFFDLSSRVAEKTMEQILPYKVLKKEKE